MGIPEQPIGRDHGGRPDLRADRTDSGAVVVTVGCELDLLTTPSFEHLILRELEQRPPTLVVDLTECAFLDSAALAALLVAHRSAAAAETRLTLAGLNQLLRRVLTISGTDSVFEIHTTVEQALVGVAGERPPP